MQIADCSEVWPEPSDVWRRGFTLLILALTYLLPLTLLSITYGLVIGKLYHRRAPGNADLARDSQQLRSKRRVSVTHPNIKQRSPYTVFQFFVLAYSDYRVMCNFLFILFRSSKYRYNEAYTI